MAKDLPVSFDGIAEITGLTRATVKNYHARGRLPEPEGHLGGVPWWWTTSIRAWDAERDLRSARLRALLP